MTCRTKDHLCAWSKEGRGKSHLQAGDADPDGATQGHQRCRQPPGVAAAVIDPQFPRQPKRQVPQPRRAPRCMPCACHLTIPSNHEFCVLRTCAWNSADPFPCGSVDAPFRSPSRFADISLREELRFLDMQCSLLKCQYASLPDHATPHDLLMPRNKPVGPPLGWRLTAGEALPALCWIDGIGAAERLPRVPIPLDKAVRPALHHEVRPGTAHLNARRTIQTHLTSVKTFVPRQCKAELQ